MKRLYSGGQEGLTIPLGLPHAALWARCHRIAVIGCHRTHRIPGAPGAPGRLERADGHLAQALSHAGKTAL